MQLLRSSFLHATVVLAVTSVAAAQPGAGALTIDRTGVGHLELDGPGVETWSFVGAAGQVLGVTVRSEAFEPTIQIVSPGGEEIARDDDGGPLISRGVDDARLVAHVRGPGRHLVRVATGEQGSGGAYEITVRALKVRPIEIDKPVRARYEDASGAAVWSFAGRADQVVSVTVHADGFSPILQLTSPGGEPLAREDDTRRHSAADGDARLVAVLPVGGRYHVEIHDAYLSHSGAYRLARLRLRPTSM